MKYPEFKKINFADIEAQISEPRFHICVCVCVCVCERARARARAFFYPLQRL